MVTSTLGSNVSAQLLPFAHAGSVFLVMFTELSFQVEI